VAVILDMLYGGNAPAHVLRAALYHDVAEHVFGDIPSPAKRLFNSDELRRKEDGLMKTHNMFTPLTDWERFVMKMADLLDGLTYCTEERERGNGTLIGVWNTYHDYIKVKLDEGMAQFSGIIRPDEFTLITTRIGHIAGIIWSRMEAANAQR
jgi:5'-deoxynucleotidase YfbR-like HD superfamily hydrolase